MTNKHLLTLLILHIFSICLNAQICVNLDGETLEVKAVTHEGVYLADKETGTVTLHEGLELPTEFTSPEQCYGYVKDTTPEALRVYSDSKHAYVHLLHRGLGQTEVKGQDQNLFIQNVIKKALELKKVKLSKQQIQDDVFHWCSSVVVYMEDYMGKEIPKDVTLSARSFLNYGKRIYNTDDVKIGDIVVLWRVCNEGCWQGHVGYFMGMSPNGLTVYVLGGNQKNQINITGFNSNKILGWVRPINN